MTFEIQTFGAAEQSADVYRVGPAADRANMGPAHTLQPSTQWAEASSGNAGNSAAAGPFGMSSTSATSPGGFRPGTGPPGGRARTPVRPLYAARLPPIQNHPLGAPDPGLGPADGSALSLDHPAPFDSTSQPAGVVGARAGAADVLATSGAMPQFPKVRPTTGKPVGTMLSATSTMNGGSGGAGSKPLPAIGEPRSE